MRAVEVALAFTVVPLMPWGCLCVAEFPDHHSGGSAASSASSSDTSGFAMLEVRDDEYLFLQREGSEPVVVPSPGHPDLLSNDCNAPPQASVELSSTFSEQGWPVDLSGNEGFEYRPPASFWGVDSFLYSVDGHEARVDLIVQPRVIELATVASGHGGVAVEGHIALGGSVGAMSSVVADIDGDTLPDLVVSSPNASKNGPGSGQCYVILGDRDSAFPGLLSIDDFENGYSMTGEDSGDRACTALVALGDVNDDGFDDVAVGAPMAGLENRGRVYIVFGKPDRVPVELADIAAGGDGGIVIEGESAGDQAGASLVAADVNGGGVDEVIIGAPAADPMGMAHAGRVYVVLGEGLSSPVSLADVTSSSEGGFVINGEGEGDMAGTTLGAGSLDVDGYGDVLVGAPSAGYSGDFAGRVYAVFGKVDTSNVDLADVGGAVRGFTIDGAREHDRIGTRLSGLGLVNDDPLDDIAIGTGSEDGPDSTYVLFGKDGTAAIDLADLGTSTGFEVLSANAGDFDGAAVLRAGDVNGDGALDLLVGAPRAGASGTVYVLYGPFGGTELSLSSYAPGPEGFSIIGEAEGDEAGSSVAVGDLNDDGLLDMIIGSPGNGSGGRVYVVYGVPSSFGDPTDPPECET